MTKACEMIAAAQQELYVRLFPEAGRRLTPNLKAAEKRGVGIRFIAMGNMPAAFDIQATHPNAEHLLEAIGGRSFDIIADKAEALVGIFERDQEDRSPINWTRNRWFVIANRDSLRHDFYHCFIDKMIERGQTLSEKEHRLYQLIKSDI
jgi:hypothetical protein